MELSVREATLEKALQAAEEAVNAAAQEISKD